MCIRDRHRRERQDQEDRRPEVQGRHQVPQGGRRPTRAPQDCCRRRASRSGEGCRQEGRGRQENHSEEGRREEGCSEEGRSCQEGRQEGRREEGGREEGRGQEGRSCQEGRQEGRREEGRGQEGRSCQEGRQEGRSQEGRSRQEGRQEGCGEERHQEALTRDVPACEGSAPVDADPSCVLCWFSQRMGSVSPMPTIHRRVNAVADISMLTRWPGRRRRRPLESRTLPSKGISRPSSSNTLPEPLSSSYR